MTPNEIARRLEAGHTGVLPTETVYGIAALPTRPDAVQQVYALKGRPAGMNLPAIVGSTRQLAELGVEVDPVAQRLIDAFWPGPLTLIFGFPEDGPRAPWLAGREEVAIRLPGHALLRQVAAAAGPFLLTSANRHGVPTALIADEASRSMNGQADFVVDGGELTPVPSTIVNTRVQPYRIERPGAIDADAIRRAVEEG